MAEVPGIHLRETRAGARELKFVVDAARGPQIQAWMRANLDPDEFGSATKNAFWGESPIRPCRNCAEPEST